MLITNAEIFDPHRDPLERADIRIAEDRIAAIGSLIPTPGERVLDAGGSAVLPGLHDHHIHLLSYAASLDSVPCGPPRITSKAQLIQRLREDTSSGWLRGFAYHESIAGDIDRYWLDRHLPDRPVRIQHRSGRLWVLNSEAMRMLGGGDSIRLPENGRLYDADERLGHLIGRQLPPIERASRMLASYGVTGLTDMTPANSEETRELLTELRRTGVLLQKVCIAGTLDLPYPATAKHIETGATKIHLHESSFPDFDAMRDLICTSHQRQRPIAVHCVTEAELVFALAALGESGMLPGDRIEHASVTPPHLLDELRHLGLVVVTQPNFIAERGDAYLTDVPGGELPWLYRGRSFLDRDIPLAGGTDAPFGNADPWAAIHAAVHRRTQSGQILEADERLTPEQALVMFLGPADQPHLPRRIEADAQADLCLLNQPWSTAREQLSSSLVAATLSAGRLIFDRVNQTPV